MIEILNKTNCCGCNSCVQACPVSCIKLVEDEEGFLYPKAKAETCINCGLCERVCPHIILHKKSKPKNIYAAINPNEDVRMKSSSGGVFSALAEFVLGLGGIVVGASFDSNWSVRHEVIHNPEGIGKLRGSKYVQSYIGDSYIKIKQYLKEGRVVLFSGTPCQVKGLTLFLQKDYENLLTVEIVCHGVPSPKIWQAFLKKINPENKEITSVKFRDKSRGWSSYSVKVQADDEMLYWDYARNCLYINSFIMNLSIRPSCFNCQAKSGMSHADITLADFWGVDADFSEASDEKGVSAILIYNEKGKAFINNAGLKLYPMLYESFVRNNPSYINSAKLTDDRQVFWNLFPTEGFEVVNIIRRNNNASFTKRVINKVKRLIHL